MNNKFTEEQIIKILQEVETGLSVADVCQKHNCSEQDFYQWKAKLEGVEVPKDRRLRELERENTELKKILANQVLDIDTKELPAEWKKLINLETLQAQENEEATSHSKDKEGVLEMKQRLDYVFNATKDGIWDWDLVTDQAYCSPAYFQMLGYEPEEFPVKDGQHVWVDLIHPDDVEIAAAEIERHTANTDEPYNLEFRLRCKDGSYKWVLDRGKVVARDDNNKPTRIVGAHVDIDQFKWLENQLRMAKKNAEVANQTKSTFLANMSHELRTPLNAILGFSNLMRREALRGTSTLTKSQQENLGLIYRSGEHLLTLINNVLGLSKIEAGKTTLNVANFDLHRLLDDLVEMFSFKVEEKGLQLLLECSPDVPTFVGTDMVKLKQVMLNLLSNALKFTELGGIVIRVNCANEECTRIHFEVEDTGPGIAADELDALFEAFSQTKTGRSAKEGTGLGLAISREFIALMGGKVDVRSEVGKGTVFFFDIDVEIVKQTDVKEEVAVKQIIGLKPNQERYRILVVDDNESNRQLLVKLLQPLGFELREAKNGQEAVDIWRKWQPQLIWMDMRMPVMDGYTATRTIKAESKRQETKIIALTASTLEEERAVVMGAGCDDYYRKPFREEEILEAMHHHIGVEYIYEEVEEATSQVDPEEVLTPETLKALPAELLIKLEELAVQANIMEVGKVVEEISSYDERVARALADLADGFEYSKIARVARAVID